MHAWHAAFAASLALAPAPRALSTPRFPEAGQNPCAAGVGAAGSGGRPAALVGCLGSCLKCQATGMWLMWMLIWMLNLRTGLLQPGGVGHRSRGRQAGVMTSQQRRLNSCAVSFTHQLFARPSVTAWQAESWRILGSRPSLASAGRSVPERPVAYFRSSLDTKHATQSSPEVVNDKAT